MCVCESYILDICWNAALVDVVSVSQATERDTNRAWTGWGGGCPDVSQQVPSETRPLSLLAPPPPSFLSFMSEAMFSISTQLPE